MSCRKGNCDDVVYTGEEWSRFANFMYSSIVIANTYTKCFKWEREYGVYLQPGGIETVKFVLLSPS